MEMRMEHVEPSKLEQPAIELTRELQLKAAHAFVKDTVALHANNEDKVIHLASKVERGIVERSLLEALLAAGEFNLEEAYFVKQVLERTRT